MSAVVLPHKRAKRTDDDLLQRLLLIKHRISTLARFDTLNDPLILNDDILTLDCIGLSEKYLADEVLMIIAKYRPKNHEDFLKLYEKYFTPDDEECLGDQEKRQIKRFSNRYGDYVWSEIEHQERVENLLQECLAA